jgi:hypothetical protein
MRKLLLVVVSLTVLGALGCDRTINEVRAPLPHQPLAEATWSPTAL